MKINILITGGNYDSQAAYSAWRFCAAALQQGHVISQVFFYQSAVTVGSCLAEPLADEFNASEQWVELSSKHAIDLVVCVSAAERRGILGQEQVIDLGKSTANLHRAFSIKGLGAMHEASLASDRTVTFK